MGEEFIQNGYKIILGRRRTRVVTYENLKLQTTHPIKEEKPKKIKPSIPSDYADFNYYHRMKLRREKIRELAYNNFELPNAVMITLTFDIKRGEDYTDLGVAHYAFKKFIQRMNSHYNNFKYLATFNRQNNGNWHYHVLCNFPQSVKNKDIQRIWGNGITYITYFEKQSKFDFGIQYLISNMAECSGETHGKHGYLATKGLERNIVLTSYKEADIKEFDEVFPEILESRRKILYETKNHLGIQGETIDEETGEIFTYHIPDRELDDMLENAGYKSWDTTFTYLSSAARFEEKFSELLPAVLKPKKFKRARVKKSKSIPAQPDSDNNIPKSP